VGLRETLGTMKDLLSDLRHFTLFPRRYPALRGMGHDFWAGVVRRYRNAEKEIADADSPWFVIEWRDGGQELAFLRVLKGGFLSGRYPAIYRGFWPRRLSYSDFSRIEAIRAAF